MGTTTSSSKYHPSVIGWEQAEGVKDESKDGNFVIWMQNEVAVIKNAACKVAHDRLHSKTNIEEHFVRVPVSKELDNI